MAEYKITLDENLLQGMLSNRSALTELVESVLNQILDSQASEAIGAQPYERSDERRDHRNGYRDRRLVTRIGSLTLSVPQTRNGTFSPELFARYQRSEQAFLLAMMEMVVTGVSTRKVTKVTEELCGVELSKSTVSELTKQLDPKVREWSQRELGLYPFLIVDALVLKVRKAGRVRAQSMLIAMGIDADGHREVLGLHLGDSESESSWGEFFGALKGRGLRGVDLVVSDDHKGLVKAISTHFQGASWQRCQTHLMRNILDATPKSLQTEVRDHVRAVFNAPDEETARALTKHFVDAFAKRAPKATALLESAYEDATAVLALPVRYRRYLRTTNAAERLNEEIRRRERVIRIIPNGESAVRLVGALLMEMNEDSFLERRYFEMDEYWASKNAMPV